MTTECGVCCDKINKTNHRLVHCSCQFIQCITCVEKYLLSITNTANCMNCHLQWETDFLMKNLKKTFLLKTYKVYKENLLFERERSMMTETIPYVERKLKINELYKEIQKISKELSQIKTKRYNLNTSFEQSFEEQLNYYRQRTNYCTAEITLQNEIVYLNNYIRLLEDKESIESRKFIRGCPVSDCRGFLSTQWKCGLCNTWTCPQCHELIGLNKTESNHTCLEENIKTAELLRKDSRPCPKCAALIFRISGCPMMFCTNCHTGFDWNTGKEYKGAVHNPHYFDYIDSRERVGEENEVPRNEILEEGCGNVMPASQLLLNLECKIFNIKPNKYNHYDFYSVINILRTHNHVVDQDIRQLLPDPNIANMNRDLRMEYLMNRLPENRFKILLQQRDKKQNKNHDNLLVCQMFVQVCLDIVQRFLKQAKTKEDHVKYIEEFGELKKYVKNCFTKIGNNYNCIPYKINVYDF